MGRRILALALCCVGSTTLGSATACAPPAPAAEDFLLEAHRRSVEGPGERTTVLLSPDGTAHLTRERAGGTPLTVAFPIDAAERTRAREAVQAARFFEVWGPAASIDDGAIWTVRVRLAERDRHREGIHGAREFEPLARFLQRYLRLASIVTEVDRGDLSGAVSLTHVSSLEVPSLEPVLAALLALTSRTEDPLRRARAASLLFSLAPPEDFARVASDLLASLEGARRLAVLAAWAEVVRPAEHASRRASIVALVGGELEAAALRWEAASPSERTAFDGVLGLLAREGDPRALDVAVAMTRTHGEVGKPFMPWGLLEGGAVAVPAVLRCLEAEEARARASGAMVAKRLIDAARHRAWLPRPLTEDERAALEDRLARELVPALERRLADAAEPYATRHACMEALEAWDGRRKAAEAARAEAQASRHRAERAARARAAPPPESAGTLTISGHLLSEGDIPVPGFSIVASRPGTPEVMTTAPTGPDGSFVLAGLTEGAYDLYEVMPRMSSRLRRGGPSALPGIAAGSEGVRLRLPGSLLIGRVFQASGAPDAGRLVVAQRRDPPNVVQGLICFSGAGVTDAEGRFWIVNLLPGIYDLQVVGDEALRGASGVETGSQEHRIEVVEGGEIRGQVVDEVGAPLPRVGVTVARSDQPFQSVQTSMTDGDG